MSTHLAYYQILDYDLRKSLSQSFGGGGKSKKYLINLETQLTLTPTETKQQNN